MWAAAFPLSVPNFFDLETISETTFGYHGIYQALLQELHAFVILLHLQ
jgi:hypothetical protein